jgi:hypothetical protein
MRARGNDDITLNTSDDREYCRTERLVAFGEAGDDRLVGGWGADRLVGGPGLDVADGTWGRDRCLAETRRWCGPAEPNFPY